MTNPTEVYYGLRDDMVAEVAAFDPSDFVSKRECKYLVMPIGEGQFDTEWVVSRKAAQELARSIASNFKGCKVCAV